MQISSLKTNQTSFRAYHGCMAECTPYSDIGFLNHNTHFFRFENENTDEFIGKLLKENFSNDEKKVISIGCSYGEEVYSIAMALDALGIVSKIDGYDLSKKAICEAKTGKYSLDNYERNFILHHNDKKNIFHKKLINEFNNNFKLLNSEENLYIKKDESFSNCNFYMQDALDVIDNYEKNSIDAVACRYMLYHLEKDRAEELLKGVYEILKPNGILSIDTHDMLEYQDYLLQLGFKQPYESQPGIFQKPGEKINFSSKVHNLKYNI